MSTNLFYDSLDTPLGKMEVTASDSAIKSIHFVDSANLTRANSFTDEAKRQLDQYYQGTLEEFDLAMDPDGTDFQKGVWQALCTIGFGKTCSYSDIAHIINNPKAVRAVGSANGKNPMTIVVPCHRIIGSNGTLTGYASGVERKAWLLNHESPGLF